MVARGGDPRRLSILKTALQGASQSAEPETADSVRYILKQIAKVAARSDADPCEDSGKPEDRRPSHG
jgi:hypothetical protein